MKYSITIFMVIISFFWCNCDFLMNTPKEDDVYEEKLTKDRYKILMVDKGYIIKHRYQKEWEINKDAFGAKEAINLGGWIYPIEFYDDSTEKCVAIKKPKYFPNYDVVCKEIYIIPIEKFLKEYSKVE